MWTDGLTKEEVSIKYNGVEAAIYNTEKGQVQLFIYENNTPTGDNIEKLDVADYRPEVVEEPSEEPETSTTEQGRVEDTTENPETSDGILVFTLLTIIGFAGTTLAYKRLHN